MYAAKPGDTLILPRGGPRYDVLDAVSLEPIITTTTLWDALEAAGALGGTIWRQRIDDRGRPMGEPAPWIDHERRARRLPFQSP